MIMNNGKRKTSIRDMILIPVIILGLVGIFSNLMSVTSLLRVNKSASVIANQYLVGVQQLAAIDEGVRGVAGAAESTQTLVYDMDNISDRMDVNQRIAGDLQKETAIFKNL